MTITLDKYIMNSIRDKTMYNVTLVFSDGSSYIVTINFPDVTSEEELDVAIRHFAEQHIAGMEPHPLANIVGQERGV